MVDIRLLNEKDVEKYQTDLHNFMQIVLTENETMSQKKIVQLADKYVEDMKAFIKDGSAILIGAFDKDKIVGFHWGYVINTINGKRVHSYFNAIYPDYRRQQIGSRFFRRLEEEAMERGIYTIEAMCKYANKGAVEYHLHNGFKIERLKVVKKLKKDHITPSDQEDHNSHLQTETERLTSNKAHIFKEQIISLMNELSENGGGIAKKDSMP